MTQPTDRESTAQLDPTLVPLVERTRGLQPWRRVFHVANGIAMAFLPPALSLGGRALVLTLAILFATLLALDIARLRVTRLNGLFFAAFPALASPREAGRIASSTWYVAGVALVFALFEPTIAVAAVLVLALADPAASVVGRLCGRRRLGKGSIEGSTAFATVAFVVLSFFVSPAAAAVAALTAAAVEIAPWKLDDNVTVPLAAAAALWLLGA
jgi:dolichol kinase